MKRPMILCVLAALLLVFFLLSCTGDTGPAGPRGPAGPDGPPGPSYILAFGTFDQNANLISVGPAPVTATATRSSTGRYQVTVTFQDPFDPNVEPTLLVTVQSTFGIDTKASGDMDCYFGTSMGTSCATNEIDFEVFVHEVVSGAAEDEGFSFVILQEPSE